MHGNRTELTRWLQFHPSSTCYTSALNKWLHLCPSSTSSTSALDTWLQFCISNAGYIQLGSISTGYTFTLDTVHAR